MAGYSAGLPKINNSGGGSAPATTLNISNVTTTIANTEYFYIFPVNTKRIKIKARGNAKLQIARVSGQTNTNYITVSPGAIFFEEGVNVSSLTLYFESNKSNEVVEIWSWS